MNCKKCGKEIPAGQEVHLPDIKGVFCRSCHETAALALIRDLFSEKGLAEELERIDGESDDEECPSPDINSYMEELERAEQQLGTMPCCGAVRRSGRDDEPCWNCGAI